MKCYSRGIRCVDHAARMERILKFIKYVYLEYMQGRSHLRDFIVFSGGGVIIK
jgi:hypothetical protein